MKKYLISISILLLTTLIVLADDSRFQNALKTCSSYSETGTVKTEGMDVTSHKQILGWQGDRCVYKENVNFAGINSCITCKLTKPQINELVSVMQAYSLVQKYSGADVDTSSISAVQNNPVVKAWNKYLQDPSVCTMTTEQNNSGSGF